MFNQHIETCSKLLITRTSTAMGYTSLPLSRISILCLSKRTGIGGGVAPCFNSKVRVKGERQAIV